MDKKKIKEFLGSLLLFAFVGGMGWLLITAMEKHSEAEADEFYESRARMKECFVREYFEKSQFKEFYASYKVDCPK